MQTGIGARLVVVSYKAAALIARSLPGRVADWLPGPAGFVWSRLSRKKAAMLERHVRRAIPDADDEAIDAAVPAGFASYLRYYIEAFRLPDRSRDEIDAGFRVEGYDNIERGLAEGRGVILALPHLGGWEWAGFWLTIVKGLRVSVVVEELEPPELFAWFADLRAKFGMNIIKADSNAAAEIAAALARNEVVCLLCDRDVTGGGITVEFFGETTTLPGGPALLGLRTGAPILATGVYFEPDGMHFGLVRAPLDLTRSKGRLRADMARVTQDLADELAYLVERAPDQWHLLQPNWPSDFAIEPGTDAPIDMG